MTVPGRASLHHIAAECVTLAARRPGRHLDWSLASLEELNAVCAGLLADGPRDGGRLALSQKLTGACTGDALVRVYGRQWITHEQAPGSFPVSVHEMTAFPSAVTDRILRARPHKSLASLARVLPAVAARTQADTPGEPPASAR